jgi:hypothetical protein
MPWCTIAARSSAARVAALGAARGTVEHPGGGEPRLAVDGQEVLAAGHENMGLHPVASARKLADVVKITV